MESEHGAHSFSCSATKSRSIPQGIDRLDVLGNAIGEDAGSCRAVERLGIQKQVGERKGGWILNGTLVPNIERPSFCRNFLPTYRANVFSSFTAAPLPVKPSRCVRTW
jgi:hypothetical protein